MKTKFLVISFISIILLVAKPINCFDLNQVFFDSYNPDEGRDADKAFGSDFVEVLPTNLSKPPAFFTDEGYETQYSRTLPPLFELDQDISVAIEHSLNQYIFPPIGYSPLPLHKNRDTQHLLDPATHEPSITAAASSSLMLSTSRKRTRADATYQCFYPGCVKAYVDPYNLAKHVKADHEGIKTFACTVPGCSQSFTRNELLEGHLASAHGKEKAHKCPRCPKAFVRERDLARHIAGVHEGIKPFVCPVASCTAAFARNEQIELHLSAAHGKEKLHKCSKCPKAFARRCDLTRHIRNSHKDEQKSKK